MSHTLYKTTTKSGRTDSLQHFGDSWETALVNLGPDRSEAGDSKLSFPAQEGVNAWPRSRARTD